MAKEKGKRKFKWWMLLPIAAVLILLALNGYNIAFKLNPFDHSIKTITTEPGEVVAEGTTFLRNNAIASDNSPKGTIVREEYTTDVYENGVTYSKYCNVYLPDGYDPNRAEPYNVVYYQHGNTLDPELFNAYPLNNYMDNLFAQEGIEDCILVYTTYYMDPEGDKAERQKSGIVLAGDEHQDELPANFWMEVTQDILPLVEGKYNTYAKNDVSPDGLKATRDHRAFTGYSRGGSCVWYMFYHALEYFRWYGPMSSYCAAGVSILVSADIAPEVGYEYLKEAIDAHPDLDFFIYAQSGDATDAMELRQHMAYYEQQTETFSYGNDPERNNLYYSISDFTHSDRYAPFYLYNALPVFFHTAD